MSPEEIALAALQAAERQAAAAEAQTLWTKLSVVVTAMLAAIPAALATWQLLHRSVFRGRGLETNYSFVGAGADIDSTVTLYNRRNEPITVRWWDIAWVERGRWGKAKHQEVVREPDIPYESSGFTIPAYGNHEIVLGTPQDPFSWRDDGKRQLYLRLVLVGSRKPLRLLVYPTL